MDQRDSLSTLAERISTTDQQAEAELFTRLRPAVLTMLRVRCAEQALAEDLTQDTFRILLERLRREPIAEPEKLPAFVQGIARNLYRDHNRKNARRGTDSDTDLVESTVAETQSPLDEIQRRETRVALDELLGELTQPRDREVLHRTFFLQQEKEQVCAQLGISNEHFHRVIFRAKERFAKLIRDRRPDLITTEGAS